VILEITHTTRLRYSTPVAWSTNLLHLIPADNDAQRLLAFGLVLRPEARVRAYVDLWGNQVQYFTVRETHLDLTITARSRVETGPTPLPSGPVPWSTYRPDSLRPMLDLMLQTPLTDPGPVPPAPSGGKYAWAWIAGLIAGAPGRMRYRPGTTNVETTTAEALARGEGVCQDFAHAALGLLRAHGVPARYAGGYQFLGEDAHHDPHAWIEVWHPANVWVGFDPTSGRLIGERYVRIAVGRDYRDATPVRGHVVFAAPPPTNAAPDPPEVEVAIAGVPSRTSPLGFAPDDEMKRAAGGPRSAPAAEGVTHFTDP
jgi:transglutaminase-like putative cysteine protease